MGLDTTHDCWHGAYSSFMEWRIQLHAAITGEPATRSNLESAWLDRRYEDQAIPINVLMNHSDCDGEIPSEMCLPLARAIEELLPKLSDSGPMPSWTPKGLAVRFAQGLRLAATEGSPVEFH